MTLCIYIYILERLYNGSCSWKWCVLRGASYDVLCCIITQEYGVAWNRCYKVLLGIEWDAGAAILAPPEFTTSSFLHSRHGHLHTSPRFAQAIRPSQTAKHPQNITKNHPGRSFLRRRGAAAAGPCFWPNINSPPKRDRPFWKPLLGHVRHWTAAFLALFF